MASLFVHLFRFFRTRRILLFSVFGGLLLVFALLASQLRLESDLNRLLPRQEGTENRTDILTKNQALDRILVSVSLSDSTQRDPDLLVAYVQAFADTLRMLDRDSLIARIEDRQDEEQWMALSGIVQDNLPFLLEANDYRRLDTLITAKGMDEALQGSLRILGSPGGLALKTLLQRDPLGISNLAFSKLNALQLDEQMMLYDGVLLSTDERVATFFLHTGYPASDTRHNAGLQELLERTKTALQQDEAFREVTAHAFGGQLVAAGNARQMQSDTRLTLGITLGLLLLLFIGFFRSAFAPLQVMIPVVFGALFSMAMLRLLRGEVSLMALGASSVILGIAVNYSLHFLSHLRHTGSREEAIRDLTHPMTIGSFTTVFAFLSLLLVHTPVLQELGLFTAFNLIGSSFCTLIFLPHFVAEPKAGTHTPATWLDRLSLFHPNRNKWVVFGIVLLTVVLSFWTGKVRFNEDMMRMNYLSPELKASQDIIQSRHAASLSTVYQVAAGKTMEEALRQSEQALPALSSMQQQGLLRRYSSVSRFLLSDSLQQERLRQWNSYWQDRKEQTLILLREALGRQGFSASAGEGLKQMLERHYDQPDSTYTAFFRQLFRDQIVYEKDKVQVLTLIKTEQAKRAALFSAMPDQSGLYLTDRQRVTATFVAFIREDFYQILGLTSLLVFLTILISYGRIEIALISFIPMVVTWICILGLMGLFGIEFNIINIIISTLIFGLGDDYSIFITDGLIEKYATGRQKILSVKTSIYLSALTTIIGLGILIFAKHPALRSIAAVSVIGIFSILLVSQTLQPLLFNFFIQNRTDKKQHPFTLWSFLKTIYAFTYYVVGCMMVTLVGFILTKCIPFAKDNMKYAYHVVICKMMWSLLYMMANVRKRITGREHTDFSKPSVIIANHASFLDLLRIISLHPKILLMTNRWVWHSPVFGALVRMADYYPVEEGAEFSIDKLQYWADRGYTIAVFPEGTRSYDDEVKRFKKGAFYLAEKLQLDIQPAIFQGVGYCIRKGDFLLKDGEINVQFLPRISPNDTRFGTTYTERAKQVGRYFRAEYNKLRRERETVHYFREQLIRTFQYKGPVLEWYCRIKTTLEKNYEALEKLVPREGHILDLGCGYGFLDYMLAWTSEQRRITGMDYDDEKITIAQHGFSRPDTLQFISGDAMHFPEAAYDCILILDMLHYLLPEQQQALLDRCVQHLAPGGVLIVRDGIKELGEKHKGTVLSEIFSTRIFRFNKTQNELHFLSMHTLEDLATRSGLRIEILDETRFTSNAVTVFRKP